jgi:CDP-diacylglycerol---glycerol-3-phosphate 3-phosphatidyltransferase
MPSIYGLKPKFQNLLRPFTDGLAGAGATANQVTLAAMVLSFATGAAIYYLRTPRSLLLLPAVLFLRMALNAIDGMLAREYNQKTALGAVLNELGDVFSDSALYLPFAVIPGLPPAPVVLIVLLGVISEMTGVIAVQVGASRRYDGPMGKSDRAFVFGALGLLLGLNLPIVPIVRYVLWFVLVLLLLTIVNRARGALAEVRGHAAS